MNNDFRDHEKACGKAPIGQLGQKLTFLAVGAGIGAAFALLFAPMPGREFRQCVADLGCKSDDRSLADANKDTHRTAGLCEDAFEAGNEILDDVQSGIGATKAEIANDTGKIGSVGGGRFRGSSAILRKSFPHTFERR